MKNAFIRAGFIILSLLLLAVVIFCLVFRNELRSLASIRKLDEHPLLSMTYYGDYGFDKFLKTGAANDREVERFITKNMTRGLPVDFGMTGGGCTVFVVKNELGETLFCRNYDFPYTPAMQVFTSPDNGFRSVSTSELDFIGYDNKDSAPSGVNPNSIFALATPYMPWDGMNDKGLAIALLAVSESYGPSGGDRITLGTTTIIRLVLDKASTVDEAVELMRQYNIYFSGGVFCHFLIADSSGKSVLAEYWDGELQTVTAEEDYQVASNFIAYNGLNIGEGYNEFERYDAAKSAIEENGGYLTQQQAIDLLTEVGIYVNGVNRLQWTVVYNLNNLDGVIFARRNTENIIHFRLRP